MLIRDLISLLIFIMFPNSHIQPRYVYFMWIREWKRGSSRLIPLLFVLLRSNSCLYVVHLCLNLFSLMCVFYFSVLHRMKKDKVKIFVFYFHHEWLCLRFNTYTQSSSEANPPKYFLQLPYHRCYFFHLYFLVNVFRKIITNELHIRLFDT